MTEPASERFEDAHVSIRAAMRLIDSTLPHYTDEARRAAYEKAGMDADVLLTPGLEPDRMEYLKKEFGNGLPVTWGELLDSGNHSLLGEAAKTTGRDQVRFEREEHEKGFLPLPVNETHMYRHISRVASLEGLSGITLAQEDATNANLPRNLSRGGGIDVV